MSPEDSHKPLRIYKGGLILGVNTLYMFFCFFKLFAVVGNELILSSQPHDYAVTLLVIIDQDLQLVYHETMYENQPLKITY